MIIKKTDCAKISATMLMVVACATGCDRRSPEQRQIAAFTEDLIWREDRSRQKIKIQYLRMGTSRDYICGAADIGERKSVPYAIELWGKYPDAPWSTVHLVLTVPPYKGAPALTQEEQAARIEKGCREHSVAIPEKYSRAFRESID